MRMIDADSAKLAVSDYKIFRCQLGGLMDVAEFIDDQPTIDAVPVVRCRECDHKTHDENGKPYCLQLEMYLNKELDFFCKYGEREEGADNEP